MRQEEHDELASSRANNDPPRKPRIMTALWPRVIEVWMAVLLLAFFIIRILGSNAAQRLFAHFGDFQAR